ncbi:hypothetical protein A9P44_19380 [Paenibacillus polymyxa]|nr:hypothetical protein AV545_23055 [Paenibacillus jamilae]OBA03793.1 hypothetical protein A9P44_19380 [Paenibacillus polymyxa]
MSTISAAIVFSKEHREVLFLYSFSNIYLIHVQSASVPRQRLNCIGFYPIIKNVISKFGVTFLMSGFCKIRFQSLIGFLFIYEEGFE